MTPEMHCAIVTGAIIGTIMAIPLLIIYRTLRLLLKVIAQSKLSLDDYLDLELERKP